MLRYSKPWSGTFKEVQYGKEFSYQKIDASDPTNSWFLEQGLTHIVDVLDGVRGAIVKKTVAYVCTDEDELGNAVLEKWTIRNHKVLDN